MKLYTIIQVKIKLLIMMLLVTTPSAQLLSMKQQALAEQSSKLASQSISSGVNSGNTLGLRSYPISHLFINLPEFAVIKDKVNVKDSNALDVLESHFVPMQQSVDQNKSIQIQRPVMHRMPNENVGLGAALQPSEIIKFEPIESSPASESVQGIVSDNVQGILKSEDSNYLKSIYNYFLGQKKSVRFTDRIEDITVNPSEEKRVGFSAALQPSDVTQPIVSQVSIDRENNRAVLEKKSDDLALLTESSRSVENQLPLNRVELNNRVQVKSTNIFVDQSLNRIDKLIDQQGLSKIEAIDQTIAEAQRKINNVLIRENQSSYELYNNQNFIVEPYENVIHRLLELKNQEEQRLQDGQAAQKNQVQDEFIQKLIAEPVKKALDFQDLPMKMSEAQEVDTRKEYLSEDQDEENIFFDANQEPHDVLTKKTMTPEYREKIRNNNTGPFHYKNEYFGYDDAADRGYSKYQTIVFKNANSKVPEQLKERILSQGQFPEEVARYYKTNRTLTPEQCRDYYLERSKRAKERSERKYR